MVWKYTASLHTCTHTRHLRNEKDKRVQYEVLYLYEDIGLVALKKCKEVD